MPTGEKIATIRIDNKTLRRVDALAGAMNGSRGWVIKRAIDRCVDYEKWFARKVQTALEQAEAGDVVEHEVVERQWERKRETSVDSRRHP